MRYLFCSAAAAALAVSTSAMAQTAAVHAAGAEAGSTVEEIVVTGSRIQTNGFQQPTPVTVVGQQELQRAMPVTIANYLNDLPSFGASNSARNPGIGVSGGGAESVNLRSLG